MGWILARPKEDLSKLTINQLETLTGATYRSIKKHLKNAGLEPLETDDNCIYYEPREALPIIFESTNALKKPKLPMVLADPNDQVALENSLDPFIQKARKDRAQANKAEFELDVLKKKYVLATEVKIVWTGIFANFRSKCLEFASANAPSLFKIKDLKALQLRLEELMHGMLEELSEYEHDNENDFEDDESAAEEFIEDSEASSEDDWE